MTQQLPKRLNDMMKTQGLSIRELERRAGLKKSVVHNIIAGKSKTPTIRTLMAICDVLGCSVESITSGREDKVPVAKQGLPFDGALLVDCVEAARDIFETLNLEPDASKAFEAIQEIYLYGLKKPTPGVDRDFARWFINKTFLED